jgi:hypothetical protein
MIKHLDISQGMLKLVSISNAVVKKLQILKSNSDVLGIISFDLFKI